MPKLCRDHTQRRSASVQSAFFLSDLLIARLLYLKSSQTVTLDLSDTSKRKQKNSSYYQIRIEVARLKTVCGFRCKLILWDIGCNDY